MSQPNWINPPANIKEEKSMKLMTATQAIPKNINDFNKNLHYNLHGDYYLPILNLSDADKTPIGRYGRMRMTYLREHRPGLYTRLLLSGKLCEHLIEMDSTCRKRMSRIVPQMAKAEGINEALKASDPMAWVGRMNSIHHQAEEIIMAELIYA